MLEFAVRLAELHQTAVKHRESCGGISANRRRELDCTMVLAGSITNASGLSACGAPSEAAEEKCRRLRHRPYHSIACSNAFMLRRLIHQYDGAIDSAARPCCDFALVAGAGSRMESGPERWSRQMKVVVLDARGLIGTKVVSAIRGRRHEVYAASPNVGVNIATGEGLSQALAGAQVVIDVSTSPSSQDSAALALVEKCCLNLLSAASAAHVEHHVALSEVGTGLLDSEYFRSQKARENLIEASLVPHTILRSTQFFECIDQLDRFCVEGQTIRVAPACVQPVLSDEVAAALADLAVSFPRNSTLEMAGPERLRLDEMARRFFSVTRSAREVITDARAQYFGAAVSDGALIPDDEAIIGVTRFEEWLSRFASFPTNRGITRPSASSLEPQNALVQP
jgi:uncharacterized protein YbjT (DUF2867 family)